MSALAAWRGALARVSARLAEAGVEDPAREAPLLAQLAAGRSLESCIRDGVVWTPEQAATLEALTGRRAAREPLAYIRGWQEFWGLRLTVSPACLVPRPETETLVERALALIPSTPGTVVDVGTGSGAIALALAVHGPPAWRLVGVDCDPDALLVAQGNRDRLGLSHRVDLYQSDLLSGVEGPLLAIVANLPYVDAADPVDPEVRWEPRTAVYGDHHGLGPIQRLVAAGAQRLEPGGVCLLEIGAGQADAVLAAFRQCRYQGPAVACDLAGRPRVVWGWQRGG